MNNPKGAIAETVDPTLEQAVGVETIARWIGLFFRAHIYGDEAAREYVHVTGDAVDDNVTVESLLP